jgi:acyl carrier protein
MAGHRVLVYHPPERGSGPRKRVASRTSPRPSVVVGEAAPHAACVGSLEVRALASVYERVRSIVSERLGVDEEKVTMDAEFIGDLNADSLDLVEVIMAMEQEFDLEIKDEDAENIRSVADAVRFIEENSA